MDAAGGLQRIVHCKHWELHLYLVQGYQTHHGMHPAVFIRRPLAATQFNTTGSIEARDRGIVCFQCYFLSI